jgi:hypothetical protein
MTLNKQFYQVYDFTPVADIEAPERGQIVVVTNTPDFGQTKIQLITDGKHTIRQLYESWKNGEGSPFRTSKAQDIIDAGLQQNITNEVNARKAAITAEEAARTAAINAEAQARTQGDADTLTSAKAYADEAQLATQTWVRAVNLKSDLALITGLNKKLNYLCRVIADPVQANNGVYQAIAGWSGSPVWTYFSDNQDWIDETELADAVGAHDQSAAAHPGIRAAIADEAHMRNEAIAGLEQGIDDEATARENADNGLQEQIDALSPEGIGNLPTMFEEIEEQLGQKAPKNHASMISYYGAAEPLLYGHARYPSIGTTENSEVLSGLPFSLPIYFHNGSKVINLNDYNMAGIYVFSNPASGSLNFPTGWGTGTSNAAILLVLPFDLTTLKQILWKKGTNLSAERYSTSSSTWAGWVYPSTLAKFNLTGTTLTINLV